MSCDEIEALLYDYARNQLDEARRAAVDVHLKACRQCSENLRLMQETLPVLDSWQTPRLSNGAADRLAQSVRNRNSGWWQRVLQCITLPSRFMLPVQAVAVVALALVFIVNIQPEDKAMVSRSFTIEMADTETSNPIRLKVQNVQAGMDDLKDLVEQYGGQIRRHRNAAIVVGLSIDPDREQQFFDGLKNIGALEKPAQGYQAEDGTLVVVIVE
jgi:hypothetical protein